MTPAEAKFIALLVDCERVIKPYAVQGQKWEVVDKNRKQTKAVLDERASISYSYSQAQSTVAGLATYEAAKAAFERDKIFGKAAELAGYWGTFDAVLGLVISASAQMRRSGLVLAHAAGLEKLRELRRTFSKTHIECDAKAKIFGIQLTRKHMHLPDDIELIRLNIRERNKQQPVMNAYHAHGWNEMMWMDSESELRVHVTVPVDHSKEGALFLAQNEALQTSSTLFSNVVDAILVALPGKVEVGATELRGELEWLPSGRRIREAAPPPANTMVGQRDVSRIGIAYDLISGGRKGDKTLSRALHRFILGRRRSDLVDRLVDYVIAWEAVSLTHEGNPIAQELSYRFALNGASLLAAVDSRKGPFYHNTRMRAAYVVRSTVVHGGGDSEINRRLRAGDFDSLQEVCDYLEQGFRSVLLWLANKAPSDRPYRKHNGWEELIWGTSA